LLKNAEVVAMGPDEAIDRAEWHLRHAQSEAEVHGILESYRTLQKCLLRHGFLAPQSPFATTEIGPKTALLRGDLTDDGFEFLQLAHDPWLGKLDRGTDPRDDRYLERKVREFRSGRRGKAPSDRAALTDLPGGYVDEDDG
jgi:hypothetical protein